MFDMWPFVGRPRHAHVFSAAGGDQTIEIPVDVGRARVVTSVIFWHDDNVAVRRITVECGLLASHVRMWEHAGIADEVRVALFSELGMVSPLVLRHDHELTLKCFALGAGKRVYMSYQEHSVFGVPPWVL